MAQARDALLDGLNPAQREAVEHVMCKAVDRGMRIGDVRLLEKRGGVHGDYAAG